MGLGALSRSSASATVAAGPATFAPKSPRRSFNASPTFREFRPRGCPSRSDHPMIRRQAADDLRWKHDIPSQRPTRHLKLTLKRVTRHFSSGTPPTTFRILIGTRVDPACLFHKLLQSNPGYLATSDVPQCPCPFADCFILGKISARAANTAVNGSAFLSKGSPANLNACRKSFLVFRRTL